MFGFLKQQTPLRRYTSDADSEVRTKTFYIERASDGARLLNGRSFCSCLAAYMLVSSLVAAESTRVRIVDADGHVLFTSPANNEAEPWSAAAA